MQAWQRRIRESIRCKCGWELESSPADATSGRAEHRYSAAFLILTHRYESNTLIAWLKGYKSFCKTRNIGKFNAQPGRARCQLRSGCDRRWLSPAVVNQSATWARNLRLFERLQSIGFPQAISKLCWQRSNRDT